MSSSLTALDGASLALLALLALLGLLVLWSRRALAPPAPPDEAGDWLENSQTERETLASSQPALALTLLEPTTSDGAPPLSLPGDLAVFGDPPTPRAEPLGLSLGTKPRDEASPARLRSSDPTSASILALLDPAVRPADEATADTIHPTVLSLARLLVLALALVVLLHRLLFG